MHIPIVGILFCLFNSLLGAGLRLVYDGIESDVPFLYMPPEEQYVSIMSQFPCVEMRIDYYPYLGNMMEFSKSASAALVVFRDSSLVYPELNGNVYEASASFLNFGNVDLDDHPFLEENDKIVVVLSRNLNQPMRYHDLSMHILENVSLGDNFIILKFDYIKKYTPRENDVNLRRIQEATDEILTFDPTKPHSLTLTRIEKSEQLIVNGDGSKTTLSIGDAMASLILNDKFLEFEVGNGACAFVIRNGNRVQFGEEAEYSRFLTCRDNELEPSAFEVMNLKVEAKVGDIIAIILPNPLAKTPTISRLAAMQAIEGSFYDTTSYQYEVNGLVKFLDERYYLSYLFVVGSENIV